MARNTRTFADIDLRFTKHPVTEDIGVKYDENAVKQAVKNLVLTNHYERPFHPEIGSQINSLLFEPFSPMLQSMMEQAITNTITNFEPRVVLMGVDVIMNPDNTSVFITIMFRIVNTERPLTVDITLQRTR